MSAGSRDMIGAVIGLLSLLLALVLGTLVGSAYGFFATQKADIELLWRARWNWIWRFGNTDQRLSRCAKR